MFKEVIIWIFLVVLFFILKHYANEEEDLAHNQAKQTFFDHSINWVVKRKYIDTESHMSSILTIIDLKKDSEFTFMPSSLRLPSSFYISIRPGDSLLKGEKTLSIVIKSGSRSRMINCDTWFWSNKPIPYGR